MSDPKFSPGPWRVRPNPFEVMFEDANGQLVPATDGDERLIAAAPEMYELLRYLVKADEPGRAVPRAKALLVRIDGTGT